MLAPMAKKLHERTRPAPWLRFFLRAPITLYRVGLGRLLGQRFILLHHIGRKTGRERRTVLQVVERERDTYYVTAGFGTESDWFKNLQHTPEARIEVGARKLRVAAHPLDLEEGAALMRRYARAHPSAARMLAKSMGYEVDGSEADYAELPKLGLSFVALRTKQAA
jgi:deazaflavin-dependent oxidoreductase (nitroreductase family)